MRKFINTAALIVVAITGQAQEVSDFAVQVSARVQTDPPQILLSWPGVQAVNGYFVYRKLKGDPGWNVPVLLPGTASEYLDTNVVVGGAYEYYLKRSTTGYDGHGYIFAGIQVPAVEFRGTVVLVVDSTYATSLGAELARLEQDLVGDGWKVLRHDVPRAGVEAANEDPAASVRRLNEVAAVKRLIQSDFLADRSSVRAVFLLGHVAIPYSGLLDPDGHLDHNGAWPADVYYGDMDGTWTDSSVSSTAAADPRNHNVPGDGKFDQTYVPASIALEVGRVDMANLPIFPQGELELLRQYLDKDHRFRHKLITAQRRALIDDNLGLLSGGVPAVNGWANFAPLFGAESTTTGRWLSDLVKSDYLWAYGCGAGTYTRATGVADTSHFIVYDTKVVFTMLFGSYFGDWDSQNNLLRGQLAVPGYTLTSAWVGRPNWFFHHMGLGETIGFSTRVSQNNTGLYRGNNFLNGVIVIGSDNNDMQKVHMALMGDPTLRLHPVAPPLGLTATTNLSAGVDLSWGASGDAVAGYHVYRANQPEGPYVRLTDQPTANTNFTDLTISSETCYMVRAIKLESSASGTYLNMSQGAFAKALLDSPPAEDGAWAGRGSHTWRINDAEGAPGASPGWDWIQLPQGLNLTATPLDRFTVRIASTQTDGTPGEPIHFNNNTAYRWPILTAASPISGFDPAKIDLRASDFQGDLGGGVISLALTADGTTVELIFSPNHPPLATPASYSRARDAGFRIDLQDLLARFTSDSDGDGRALIRVGTSTNGSTIATDGNYLFFAATNNLPETISYSVQDIREYRAGDSVRVATSTITIEPVPTDEIASAQFHAIEIEWQSEAGKLYRLQSRPDSDSEWTDQGEPIAGTGQTMSIFDRTRSPARFYRIIPIE